MSQNPNGPEYNPYGPGPSNPNYPSAPGNGYGGQPPSGPNPIYGQPPSGPNPNYNQPPSGPNPIYGQPPSGPNSNYGQPPSGPNPTYGQYAPPPPPLNDPTPNSSYGTPPYNSPYPQAGPYDQTVFSQSSPTSYPAYPTPSNPGFGTPVSNPGFGTPVSNPGFGMPPTPPPAKKSNARIIIISVVVLLLIAGSILGGVLYNNHQTTVHNNDLTATAQTLAQITSTAQAHASATANAQATATYIQTHYPFSSNLVLNDPLKDNSGVAKYGWDVGSECAFTNGAYEATEKQANFILPCAAESTHFANFTYEIQMAIKTGGAGAEGGVIFRANMDTYALYILFIDTDGNYSLDLRANSSGASTRTLSSGRVPNFATGFYQVHTIGIVANGSQITVYIDQNQVAKVTDTTYTNGQIGVISDYGSSATTVAYSNAKVWQL